MAAWSSRLAEYTALFWANVFILMGVLMIMGRVNGSFMQMLGSLTLGLFLLFVFLKSPKEAA